jgi:hypothetical protein
MTIGVSLILIAVGAILVWGVTTDAEGLNVDAIGVILMIVGFVGALLSLIFWSEWSPAYRGRRRAYVDDGTVVRRRTAAPRRTVVEEEEVVERGAPPPPPPP